MTMRKQYHFESKLLYILIRFCIALFVFLLAILPLAVFRIGIDNGIFPMIEVIIVYYLAINYNIQYWQLFLIGIIFDLLYHLPVGVSSIALLIGNCALTILIHWIVIKANFVKNYTIFCIYCLLICIIRYLLILIKVQYAPPIVVLFFQYLTTIFAYPCCAVFIDKVFSKSKVIC